MSNLDHTDLDGFLVGKQAAIVEWAHRKEAKSFAKLVGRLYAAKRRLDVPETVRAIQKRHRVTHREKISAKAKAKAAQRPRPMLTCACGQGFRPRRLLRKGRGATKHCSVKCREHAWGVARAVKKNRGLRNMNLAASLYLALDETGRTLRELVAAIPGAKRGSVATKLVLLRDRGVVVHEPKWRDGRWRLAAPKRPVEEMAGVIGARKI